MPDFDYSTRYARKDERDFVLGAARAFYVEQWAHQGEDENGRGGNGDKVPGGCDLLDYAPQTQLWALKLARAFAATIERAHGQPLDAILVRWAKRALGYYSLDRDPNEINLGFYAAISAMGHGVGLPDFGISSDEVPDCEGYPWSGIDARFMRADLRERLS